MLKKNLLTLFLCMGLLGNSVLSCDSFEIELRSDRIVGSLWQGISIPQKDIKAFLGVIDRNNKNHDKTSTPEIKSFLNNCYQMMEETAIYRDESKENILNIKNFIKNIDLLSKDFDPNTVETGLDIIWEKYEG